MTLSVDIELRLGGGPEGRGEFRLAASFDFGGGVTALFGDSGAGKTSLINAIAGLARPDRGRIAFDGEPLFDSAQRICVPAERRRGGVVFNVVLLFAQQTEGGLMK
jgi:molybdate transport system ATP-binding protein